MVKKQREIDSQYTIAIVTSRELTCIRLNAMMLQRFDRWLGEESGEIGEKNHQDKFTNRCRDVGTSTHLKTVGMVNLFVETCFQFPPKLSSLFHFILFQCLSKRMNEQWFTYLKLQFISACSKGIVCERECNTCKV